MNTSGNASVERKQRAGLPLVIAIVLIASLLPVYAVLDLASYETFPALMPLAQPWTNPVVYAMILAASIFAAATGLILARQFARGEEPRRIWLFFALGWCCWVLGEGLGFFYRAMAEAPEVSLMDLCWTIGYTFFAIVFFLQYRQIYDREKKFHRWHFLMILAGLLLGSAVIAAFVRRHGFGQEMSWLNLYLTIFYPVCDICIGLAAVWLSFVFGRGRWSRPWWGLIAFFFADGIYTWYGLGGWKILSPAADTWLSLFTDVLYISGYLIVGIGFLSMLLLQKYGVPPLQRTSKLKGDPSE
jgi:hypothetical protein